MAEGRIEVARDVAASPERVWELVSDVSRMGEWSPETVAADWVGGASGPAVGARFKGSNRIGWHRWSTTATVTACEPGRSFVFDVSVGPLAVAEWGYRIEPTAGGCRVTEHWIDRRGRLVEVLGRLTTGVDDRVAHNRVSMEETLERLAAGATAG